MPYIHQITMKKISVIILSSTLALLSATAFACPKGTTLQGGTGPNHKGGKCVAASGAKTKPAKTEAKKTSQTVKTTEVKTSKPEKAKTTATTTTSTTTSHEQH
ncbi:hypothetical protein D7V21_02345 [Acinetobacter guerrae]|uniref:Lipoprotein n=2 Tax=Acinetobacter guerrae TaxID=1843371 RepID=A0A3A8F4S5_9GAMM|nr:hypothetical protein D7V21_02345 [Acinetobacter guerrae]